MGLKFWAEGKFEPPAKGEWYLGADYQNYLTSDQPGNFVAFDVVERKVIWRAVSPAPFWAGAVATSTGLVFTGDMRGYFMALDARIGNDPLAVPDGLGNHREPHHLRARRQAVRRRAFRRHRRRHELLLQGAEGGKSLGLRSRRRRTRAGSDGNEPHRPSRAACRKWESRAIRSAAAFFPATAFPRPKEVSLSRASLLPNRRPRRYRPPPTFDAETIARGERLYRARCVGCHQSGGASGPNLFRTTLPREKFESDVANGVSGTLMPSFGSLLSKEQIQEIYAFVVSRDRLE